MSAIQPVGTTTQPGTAGHLRHQGVALGLMAAFFLLAPLVLYPVFLM
jgi:hypothetical protein